MWRAWRALERRWRVVSGLDGERLQGLDASQVESVLGLMGFKGKKRRRVINGLWAMEEAALSALYGNGES